jgi:hypothetical protein
MAGNVMAPSAFDEKEPPRWAFWRYGRLAYQMICAHQRDCVEAHSKTAEAMSTQADSIERVETKIGIVSTQVNDVFQTVRAFAEMQPELKTSVTRARDRRAVGEFFAFWGKIVAAVLTGGAAVLAIGVWLVPYVRAWVG